MISKYKFRYLICTLCILFSLTNSQTHIKDQIEINPKQSPLGLHFTEPEEQEFVPFKYDESMGKELIEERTLYRKVFLQPDGTKKARIYASPIHYFKNKNNLVDITASIASTNDTITISSSDGGWQIGQKPESGPNALSDEATILASFMAYTLNGCYHLKSRVLIQFPVNQIPSNSQIIDANLNITYLRYINCTNYDYPYCGWCDEIPNIERKIAANIIYVPWDEEYLSFDYPWSGLGSPGIDFKEIPEDTVIIDILNDGHQGLAIKTIFSISDAVQSWVSSTQGNHGILLWDMDEEDKGYEIYFASKESYLIEFRPYLEVTYTDSVEPKLRIIEPDSTTLGECILPYLDENLPIEQINPVMPEITCKAVFDGLSSLTTDTVDVNWEYIVEFDYKKRNSSTYNVTASDTIIGTSQISGSDTTAWFVDFIDQFLGGDVSIIASAVINDSTYSDTLNNIYEIRGTNPKQNIVRDFIAYKNPDLMYELWAIFYYESDRKFAQFEGVDTNLIGLPLFGPPAGYGVCQLDPVTNGCETLELWDWKKNVNTGINRFIIKKTTFLDNNNYYNQIIISDDMYWEDHEKLWEGRTVGPLEPVPFTDQQLMIDWMQLYNGGHYYYWVPVNTKDPNGPGKWVIHDDKITNREIGVGEIYYNKSEQFRQGNFPPPSIWNNYLQGCQ